MLCACNILGVIQTLLKAWIYYTYQFIDTVRVSPFVWHAEYVLFWSYKIFAYVRLCSMHDPTQRPTHLSSLTLFILACLDKPYSYVNCRINREEAIMIVHHHQLSQYKSLSGKNVISVETCLDTDTTFVSSKFMMGLYVDKFHPFGHWWWRLALEPIFSHQKQCVPLWDSDSQPSRK